VGLEPLIGDRGDEPVAAPWQGLDEAWGLGIVAKRLANPADRCVQAVFEIDKRIVGPELPLQFVPADQSATALDEHREQSKELVRQDHPASAIRQLASQQIQLELAEPDNAQTRFTRHDVLAGKSYQIVPRHPDFTRK
jgi:hypothetical protein